MTKETLYTMNTAFRGEYSVYGYTYGRGEKAACIVGALRGHEFQQLFICSLLSKKLARLEEEGNIVSGKQIMVIPSLNYSAMNASKKYWLSDDSDINRQFPGNPSGPATSRIAYATLEVASKYSYGIQFRSFYLQGQFIPHIRMMSLESEATNLANLFGMPYVLMSEGRPYEAITLANNWQKAGTEVFSIYSGGTERIHEGYAETAVSAVLRFLSRMGIIKYNCQGGYISTVMDEEKMLSIRSDEAGFFRRYVGTNEEVTRGQRLAEIIDPMTGNVISTVLAPTSGIIFFVHDKPMVFQNVVIYKIIRKLHK
ncbi:MAG: succinylglutamate desuccinylase/aspartoacylase family protein [Eubacterium sp.]|nr:succinylglutamate desuccinylase/aspartoacylase family protein [Eubacterium sp.]HCA21766.1 succinylglutamate desuccinylase [Lachnospiraceae bacterium]